jgi:C4-dicarboxylate-specific signal transduction histidine kinase
MIFSGDITWIGTILQLCVACYALRLNRLFGTQRVGWSLFSAFTLMGLVHLLPSTRLLDPVSAVHVRADMLFPIASMLLLAGMVHIETLLKIRQSVERQQERMRAELELRVKGKTAELIAANEELKLTAVRLEDEVAERKRVARQMEATYHELLAASRQAGLTEVATNVLHNVGNVLNSLNISASLVAEHLTRFKAASVARVGALLHEHESHLAEFLTQDPKGKQLPDYIQDLANHLVEEQSLLSTEMGLVKRKLEHVKNIVAMQQNYATLAGIIETVKVTDLIEDALQMNIEALQRHDVDVIREFEPDVPEIPVEKHKVLQILVNLIRNAKYACDESGRTDKRLILRVSATEDRVRVSVIDNGVGITSENLRKLFLHGFTTRKSGHGFGLHSGALAARDMGGVLLGHSDGPGLGATFTLELPRQQKPAKPAAAVPLRAFQADGPAAQLIGRELAAAQR